MAAPAASKANALAVTKPDNAVWQSLNGATGEDPDDGAVHQLLPCVWGTALHSCAQGWNLVMTDEARNDWRITGAAELGCLILLSLGAGRPDTRSDACSGAHARCIFVSAGQSILR